MRKLVVPLAALAALAVPSHAQAQTAPAFQSDFCKRLGRVEAAELEAVRRDVTGPTLAFAARLHSVIGDGPNAVASPFSVASVLALALAGARGPTAAELARGLGLQAAPGEDWHQRFGRLNGLLLCPSEWHTTELDVANGLFPQAGKPLSPAFVATARDLYDAKAEALDYARDHEAARRHVNAWVERMTRGKIKDLLQQGTVDAATKLTLVDAVYLKGAWAKPFPEKATRPGPFHLSARETAEVPLMRVEGNAVDFSYAAMTESGFQAAALPLADGRAEMIVLLPDAKTGLAGLEARLDRALLEKTFAALARRKVNVTMPRFKAGSELRLVPALRKLGIDLAFAPRKADFGGIDGGADLLYISEVVHKTFVDVNETGIEAAAATAAAMRAGGAPPPASEPVELRLDRPFLYLIREPATGAVLFLGRLSDPRTGG